MEGKDLPKTVEDDSNLPTTSVNLKVAVGVVVGGVVVGAVLYAFYQRKRFVILLPFSVLPSHQNPR